MTTEPHRPTDEEARSSQEKVGDRRQIAGVFLGAAAIFAIAFILQYFVARTFARAGKTELLTPTARLILSTASMYVVGMPLSLLLFRLAEPLRPARRKLPAMTFCGVVTVCFALALGGNLLGQAVNGLVSGLAGMPPVNPVEELTTGTPFWLNFLTVAILAPVLEELFFRRIVIDRLRRYGDVFAVIASGILFGLAHGNFSQFFYATVIGLILGIVYCATGNIRYTVAVHFLFNASSVILAELLGGMTDLLNAPREQLLRATFTEMMLGGATLLFYLLCVVCTPIAARFLIPRLRPAGAERRPDSRFAKRAFLLNPGFWCAVIILIGRFVYQTLPD